MYKRLGQADVSVSIGAAVANAVVALKANKLAARFQKQIESQETAMEYTKFVVSRLQDVSKYLADITNIQPGTPEFEKAIQQAMSDDLIYKGGCNADIFAPVQEGYNPGSARKIIGSFLRDGTIKNPTVPLPGECGLYWASGCKNAFDEARVIYIKKQQQAYQQRVKTSLLEDLSGMNLFLRAGMGVLLISTVLVGIAFTMQD